MHVPGFHPVVCVVVAGAEDGGVEVGGGEDLLEIASVGERGFGGLEVWAGGLGKGKGRRGEQYCGCVHQGILEFFVALEELGAQEGGVADGGEEGNVELEVRGEVGQGEGCEGHCCLGFFVWENWSLRVDDQ